MVNIRYNIKIHVVLEKSRKHFSLNQMCERELLNVFCIFYLCVCVCLCMWEIFLVPARLLCSKAPF